MDVGGSHFSVTAMKAISRVPVTNSGRAISASDDTEMTWSTGRSRLIPGQDLCGAGHQDGDEREEHDADGQAADAVGGEWVGAPHQRRSGCSRSRGVWIARLRGEPVILEVEGAEIRKP